MFTTFGDTTITNTNGHLMFIPGLSAKNDKDTFTIIDNRYNKYYYDITVRR